MQSYFEVMKLKILLTFLTAASLILLAGTPLQKTYWIEKYRVDVEILSGGHLRVSELITFAFRGGVFSYAYRSIPLRGIYSIVNVTVTSDGQPLDFTVSEEGSRVNIRWEYQPVDATYQTIHRTFNITYIATYVVKTEGGLNILDFQAIGKEWSVPIRDVEINILFPEGVHEIYPHEDIVNDIYTETVNGRIVAHIRYPYLEPGEGYRVYISFPKVIEVESPPSTQLIRKSNLGIVAVVSSAVAIFTAIFIVSRGRLSGAEAGFIMDSEPPLNPPEAGALLRGLYNPSLLASAIFDLARKGYLEFIVRVSKSKSIFGREKLKVDVTVVPTGKRGDNLKDYEVNILSRIGVAAGRKELKKLGKEAREILRPIGREFKERGYYVKRPYRVRTIIPVLVACAIPSAYFLYKGITSLDFLLIIGGVLWDVPSSILLLDMLIPLLSPKAKLLRSQTKLYLEKLKNQVDMMMETSPFSALEIIRDNIQWIVIMSNPVRWLRKILEKVEKHASGFQLPRYIKVQLERGVAIPSAAITTLILLEAYRQTVTYVYSGVGATSGGVGGAGAGAGGGAGGGGGGAG